MIASLQGILREKKPTEAVVDVNGVGFAVNIPLSTFERLGEPGSSVRLLTHLVVREDALTLFGFSSQEERDTFRILMSVNGIGPKMAQGILSGIGVSELQSAIGRGDIGALTAVPGVGRKSAERIIMELRDKITKIAASADGATSGLSGEPGIREEAVLALVSLGYNRPTAERAVAAALKSDPQSSTSLQALIKSAIHNAR